MTLPQLEKQINFVMPIFVIQGVLAKNHCNFKILATQARLLIGREPKNVSFTMRTTGSHLRGRFMYPETAGNVCASRSKN